MTQHLNREIDHLKRRIISLSTLVEETVSKAVQAVLERNPTLADEVIAVDNRIDSLEISVEEDCLKTLALHHPLSFDLRYIIAVLKINNDLERIGDQAVNIAKRARALAEFPSIPDPFDLQTMTSRVKSMLREALDSLVNLDSELARKVCRSDADVDKIHRSAFVIAKDEIVKNVAVVDAMILFLSVSRNLERIADLAENIAEDVLYTMTGDIVRHGRGHIPESVDSDSNSQSYDKSRPVIERVK